MDPARGPLNNYVLLTTPDGIRPFTGYVSGGTDYTHYDLTKPNEAYFTRLDHIVTLAAKHGIWVFIDPIETIGWLVTLRNNGLTAAYAYGQYLGNRYKSFPNIAWLNGNDFNTWKDPKDDALVEAVAKGIKSTDPGHLQTVELNVFTSSSLDDPTWVPIISLNSTYTYSPTYIQMLHSYNQTPVAPAYLVEAHYDWENVGKPPDFGTPSVLRREDYWTMLSGGTGQFYGNRYTWSFASGWESHIDTVGVTQLKVWKEFFSSLPWQDLVPDQQHTAVTTGLGTFGDLQTRVSKSDFCTAAKTPDGSFVVAYMPTAREITVNMASLKGPADAKWFDPTNGTYTTILGGHSRTRERANSCLLGTTTMATATGFCCWRPRAPPPSCSIRDRFELWQVIESAQQESHHIVCWGVNNPECFVKASEAKHSPTRLQTRASPWRLLSARVHIIPWWLRRRNCTLAR